VATAAVGWWRGQTDRPERRPRPLRATGPSVASAGSFRRIGAELQGRGEAAALFDTREHRHALELIDAAKKAWGEGSARDEIER
jgi:hypothetical protein